MPRSAAWRSSRENIANADSTAQTPGGDPYRRKIVTFSSELDRSLGAQVVKLGHVESDPSDFTVKHEPGNPAADANGDVKYPNVNTLVEMTDLRDAQRSYEANLNIITATRRMLQRTIDILKELGKPCRHRPLAAANAYAALARLGEQTASLGRSAATPESSAPNFSAVLKDVINAVSDAAQKSDAQAQAVATGKSNMVDVVTAVAETETAVQTLVSVRDKVIAAYEDILKMPI